MADRKPERRGLGRGLSALMADVTSPQDRGHAPQPRETGPRLVPIEKLRPNPNQPRREFTPQQLSELTESISEKGIIQPLILRPDPEEDGTFEIVAGERRWRAAQAAQLHDVPALVRDYDDSEVLEVAIIENIQRADLNAIEEASGYRQLMDRFGHTQERIATALGKSRSHIANLLRLLTLPEDVQDLLKSGKLTAGHARALITCENASELARECVRRELSVREAEKLAQKSPDQRASRPARRNEKDADTLALEQDRSAALGMNLSIEHKANSESGRVTITYGTLDELDSLCKALSTARL